MRISDWSSDVCSSDLGLKFGGDGAPAVVPDLYIRRTVEGWAVEINSGTLPRLLVNRRYYSELAEGAAVKSKALLSEQLAGANWLVRALDQRQRDRKSTRLNSSH